MNPGTLTSPVRGDVLERAVALRALGWQWDQIAAELKKRTGIERITGPMVGAVVRRARKVDQPAPLVKETKPTVKFVAEELPPPPPGFQRSLCPWTEPEFVPEIKPPRVPAPVVHTVSKSSAGNFLTIPDPQIPFHKRDALQFIERWRRHFSVPKENMLCAGDEVDAYFGSRFDHSPDAAHTPNSEIAAALDELKRWYAMWPYMRLANSNHGQRWVKKALRAQIPSQLMSGYREVLQAPEGWRWADSWTIDGGKSRFMLEHGHNGPQGFGGLRLRPLQNGLNTIWGHQHANAGIAHVVTSGQQVYGMCVGSLIDVESYAFEYDRANQYKPWIGVGVILNGGTTPLLVPYEREAA